MGLLQRFIAKRQSSRDKVTDAIVRTSETHRRGRFGTADIDIRRRMEMNTGYVGIASHVIANVASSTPLKLYRSAESGGDRGRSLTRKQLAKVRNPAMVGHKAAIYANAGEVEEVTDHPVLDLFRDPTPFGQAFGFRHLMHLQSELCGNAFLHIFWDDDAGRPWLVNLFPQYVEVVPDEQARLTYYFGRDSTSVKEFPRDEILHYKHQESLYKPYLGDSWVSTVLREHEHYIALMEHESSRWSNAARPDLVIGVPDGVSETQLDAMQRDWDSKHRGSRNAGKVVFAKAATIAYDNTKPHEMDYGEGRQWIKTVIANASGVPASMLDMTDASLGSALAGDSQFSRLTIQPRLCREAEFWTERLLGEEYGIDPGDMWFAPDIVLEEDETQVATRLTSLSTGGVITLNEARSELGYEPVDGGEVLRVNGQSIESLDAGPQQINPHGFPISALPTQRAAAPVFETKTPRDDPAPVITFPLVDRTEEPEPVTVDQKSLWMGEFV